MYTHLLTWPTAVHVHTVMVIVALLLLLLLLFLLCLLSVAVDWLALLLPLLLPLLLLLRSLLPLHQAHVFLVQRCRETLGEKLLLAPGIKRMSRSLWLSVTT